jgi:hypothetical protein
MIEGEGARDYSSEFSHLLQHQSQSAHLKRAAMVLTSTLLARSICRPFRVRR